MGPVVDHCYNCRRPLRAIDFERGRAIQVGSLTACENCAVPLLARLTPEQQKAILRKLEGEPPPEDDGVTVEDLTTEAPPPKRPSSAHLRARRPPTVSGYAGPPLRKKGIPAAVWIAGAGAILLVLVLALAGGDGKPATDRTEPDVAKRGISPASGTGVGGTPAPIDRAAEEAARRREALLGEIAALEKDIRAAADARTFKEALARVEAARSRRSEPEWEQAVARLAKEVRDAADGAFFRIKSKALDAQELGNADAVKPLRDEVAAWGIATYVEELDRALEEQVRKRAMEDMEGWWKLDETGGTTAADASGKGRTGTLRGGATWKPGGGRSGGALRIVPGAAVECAGVNLANRSFTLCAWIKREEPGRWNLFLGQGKAARNEGLHFGYRDNNKFTLAFYGNDLDTGGAYTDTEWTHWTGTYDIVSKKRRIYRNGERVAENTSRDPYRGSGTLWIGRGPQHDAQGLVDDVRVYSRALSDSEVETLYRDASTPASAKGTGGLVGWWKLDEASGTIARDASGGGQDGRLYGSPEWVSEARGPALAFRKAGDYVDTGFVGDLPRWTVVVWVKSPAPPGDGQASGPVHREGNFQLSWNHGDPSFRGTAALRIRKKWYAVGFGSLAGDRWHHLAATYDGETLKTYTDGAPAGTNEAPSGPPDPEPLSLKFARHAEAGNYFTGALRDVRLYDRPLSADEIKALYEGRQDPGR